MQQFALAGWIGPTEMVIVLGIIVLLFGARKIPELAKGLGEGIRSFRAGVKGDDESQNGGGELPGGTDKP
jgi:sec-independent protein translocase protein TatA